MGGEVAQHVQAEVAVEHVLAAERLLVLGRVEVRDGSITWSSVSGPRRSMIWRVFSPRSAPISTMRRAPAASSTGAMAISQNGNIRWRAPRRRGMGAGRSVMAGGSPARRHAPAAADRAWSRAMASARNIHMWR